MGFIIGVDEMFDFGHAEFSDAEETGAGCNFFDIVLYCWLGKLTLN